METPPHCPVSFQRGRLQGYAEGLAERKEIEARLVEMLEEARRRDRSGDPKPAERRGDSDGEQNPVTQPSHRIRNSKAPNKGQAAVAHTIARAPASETPGTLSTLYQKSSPAAPNPVPHPPMEPGESLRDFAKKLQGRGLTKAQTLNIVKGLDGPGGGGIGKGENRAPTAPALTRAEREGLEAQARNLAWG